MSEHVGDMALEHALGALAAGARAAVDAHAAGCADCAELLRQANEEVAGWALAAEPVAPSSAARARFDAAIADAGAFAPLVSALARMADLADDAMRKLVGTLDDAAAWVVGPADGIHVVHVDGGPRTAGCIVGFVRIAKGTAFPHHAHLGHEAVMILQGELHDDADGSVARAGDLVEREAGTAHAVRAGDDLDVIYLVNVQEGIELEGGDVIGPADPRI
jgi:predicted ChrR family anti-sigma factor